MVNIPAIRTEHIDQARVFANRKDMVVALCRDTKIDVIGEVGVALGDFSEFLLQTLKPKKFVGFDIFDLHNMKALWGKDTKEIFQGLSHYQYYLQRLSRFKKIIVAEHGSSHETIARFPDASFDLIYLDADHRYDGVKRDAELAARKLTQNGLLIFNDYIMYDHVIEEPYGVVPVVNEMVVEQNWCVVGFALQQQMFCDIALRRRPA